MNNLENYLNVITSEHRAQPQYLATVTAYLQKLQEVNSLLESWDLHLGLEDALGKQLDGLGETIGRKRTLPFQPDGCSATLDDDNYRLILKAKILQNQWNGTMQGMSVLFDSIFPTLNLEIIDYQDMSMQANVVGLQDNLQLQLLNQGYIIPKPEGVRLKIVFVIVADRAVNIRLGAALQTGTQMRIYPIFSDDLAVTGQAQFLAYSKQGTTLSIYPRKG